MGFMVIKVDIAWLFHTFSINYFVFACLVAKRAIELHTYDEKESRDKKVKALRVPRAVNNGWRFTARMQVGPKSIEHTDFEQEPFFWPKTTKKPGPFLKWSVPVAE